MSSLKLSLFETWNLILFFLFLNHILGLGHRKNFSMFLRMCTIVNFSSFKGYGTTFFVSFFLFCECKWHFIVFNMWSLLCLSLIYQSDWRCGSDIYTKCIKLFNDQMTLISLFLFLHFLGVVSCWILVSWQFKSINFVLKNPLFSFFIISNNEEKATKYDLHRSQGCLDGILNKT